MEIDGSLSLTLHPLIFEVMPSSQLHSTLPSSSMTVVECAEINLAHISFERRELGAPVVTLLFSRDIVDQNIKSNSGGLALRDLSLQVTVGARHGAELFAKITSFSAHFNPETEEFALCRG